MKVVILAGGLGTRLGEETSVRPKPMVEIGHQPILWHIMKLYSKHGLNDFVILCGYKSHIIKDYFINYAMRASDVTIDFTTGETTVIRGPTEPWKVTLLETGLDTNHGGRLGRARDYIDNSTFCMHYGDTVSDVDITKELEFHKTHNSIATMTLVQPPGRFGAVYMAEGEDVIASRTATEPGSTAASSCSNPGSWITSTATKATGASCSKTSRTTVNWSASDTQDSGTQWIPCRTRTTSRNSGRKAKHHGKFGNP
jgi:glucose-1-phosphate cytidylyltransferase